jgi:HK97 family phage major capsid protein
VAEGAGAVTPRISPRHPPRHESSFELFRHQRVNADIETRAFWNYMVAPATGIDPRELLTIEEQRVLSKGASGGGFLVPTDLAELIVSAARAQSALAQLSQEFVTSDGATFNVPLGGSHGTAAWTAESGTYTASDETITQQPLSAFKGTSKIIVSEELLRDEEVQLDQHLAGELGARLGALEGAAFCAGDGSGKALGITNAGSGYSTVTAATGSATLFKVADVVAAYKALPAAYRPAASFIFHPDDFASLAGTTDTAGSLAIPSLSFSPPSLLGLPVFLDAGMPSPAANAKSAAIGDWRSAYAIRRVQQPTVDRLTELHSDSGQVGYRAFSRTDGRPTLTDAARLLVHSAT